MAGVPSSQTMDRYWPVVCLELDTQKEVMGGIYRYPPSLLLPPDLLSDQRWD